MASTIDTKVKGWLNPSIDRRKFLKGSAALAAGTAAMPILFKHNKALAATYGQNEPTPTDGHMIRSVCQMCHARCGIQATVKNGILLKLDGNPYHPNCMEPDERLAYSTSTSMADKKRGRLCLKGQSGIQTVYDPYRVKQPLKRKPGTARGAGQWEAISWDEAFDEIAGKINTLIPESTRYQDMDPAFPEKGKNANMLGFAPGRSVEKTMSERVWKHGWGTANYGLSHTSVCEVSRHVANELITWKFTNVGGKNRLGKGNSEGWQPDTLESEFIILWGSNPFEAGFPMNPFGRKLVEAKRKGAKFVVVDPRFSNTAAQAAQWIPVKPGADAALALAMARWIIENNRHDKAYLRSATKGAAHANNEFTWTDSTYLVKYDSTPATYLTSAEAGIGSGTNDNVVLVGRTPTVVPAPGGSSNGHSGDTMSQKITGDLDVATTVNGINVKSAFTLFKEEAMSRSIADWATICGVKVADIQALAGEFVSHGKKAVAITYRGPIKHTNGLYSQLCIQHLNTLIGNYDWRGGCTSGAGGYGDASGLVTINGEVKEDPGHPGIAIDRHGKFYDKDDAGKLFDGTYPAKRIWGPFWTHTNYQEVIPSVEDAYPYPMKVMITYWNAWPYSVPGLKAVWERTLLSGGTDNYDKLPLLVSISPVMGEVAEFADYVLPDSVYLEKFAVPGIPWMVQKGTAFQRPVVGKFDGKDIGGDEIGATIPMGHRNDYTPVLPNTKAVVDIHIGLAKALGLDGRSHGGIAVGDGAFDDGSDLNNSWDYAHAMLRNIVANASSEVSGLSVTEVLAKGGVFLDTGTEYGPGPSGTGNQHLTGKYGQYIRLYNDPLVHVPDSATGEYWSGVPHYQEIMHSDGTPVDDGSAYPYRLNTHKLVNHGQARTAVNPWLMLVMPSNAVWINSRDAATIGVVTGDTVRLTSASNNDGVTGLVLVTERIMPGVVGVSHHYGHWQLGSKPYTVGDEVQGVDPSRGAGTQTNPISRLDRHYNNVSLQDKIGGSVSFYDTNVNVTKV